MIYVYNKSLRSNLGPLLRQSCIPYSLCAKISSELLVPARVYHTVYVQKHLPHFEFFFFFFFFFGGGGGGRGGCAHVSKMLSFLSMKNAYQVKVFDCFIVLAV